MNKKRIYKILIAMACIALVMCVFKAVVSATDEIPAFVEMETVETESMPLEVEIVTEGEFSATGEVPEVATEEGTEEVTDAIVNDVVDIGEVQEIVEQSASFSEAVVAMADKLGISIQDAEELISAMQSLGDKYLGETALWETVKKDMATYPEKYIVIALVMLILLAMVIFMLRWIIANIGQIRTIKLNMASIKKSLDGDEEGEGNSLRSLISSKNTDVIKALEEKNASLEEKLSEVFKKNEELSADIIKAKENTDSALSVMQESAIQIAQLLYIAMDKGKIPAATKETRQVWFDNAREKILDAAKAKEVKASDNNKTEEKISGV